MLQPVREPRRRPGRQLQNISAHPARALAIMLLGLVLLAPVMAQAKAKYLYRYQNAQGRPEISHTIPPDRVALGYEVIDRTGRVIKRVERQKTAAEVERINRETLARNACKRALERVNSLYQSELDIGYAEEQAITSLEGRIANAVLNLRQAQEQKRDMEATAAQLERSGKSLDTSLRRNIERADFQINTLEEEIGKREQEKIDARKAFANDLALFKQATCENEAALGFVQTDIARADSD
ncbi:MAG: hypothetical protein OES38_18765 [Gammaproteobacteria bacterium]|nr:hypothetical protein [Gammaproteobacteria bacterium]